MRLRVRLSLISAVVTTASTLVVGVIGINSQHEAQIALIDKSLNQVASSVNGETNAALSEAFLAVQQSDISLTLIYYSEPTSPLVLTESKMSSDIHPSRAEVKAAFSNPVTNKSSESYRMRAIQMLDDEYVVIATTLQEVESRFSNDRMNLALFIFLCLLLAAFVTWFFFRRDIRKIESLIATAGEISRGKSDIEIVVHGGNSEIDELAESLNRMVATLRKTAELEELASQRMQDFLGDASHELRTPLTVIRGYIELLAGAKFTDVTQRERAFARVASEIARMESLINDLLFLAESGMAREAESSEFDLSALLSAHLDDFRHVNPERVVEFEITPSIGLLGSTAHVARLFTNIFGNISRHTPSAASVHVALSVNRGEIQLLIEDGGPGLPDSVYERGVQSFQRFDKSRSREAGGSGLGMSIIFAIVKELGGEISLRQSDLGGLAVEIYFDKLDE